MLNVVHVLELNFGSYPPPMSLVTAMEAMPMRTVKELGWDGEMVSRTRPDRNTPEGRKYYAYLNEQERREIEAYKSGDEFKPGEYTQ